jgi:hypothetical protein
MKTSPEQLADIAAQIRVTFSPELTVALCSDPDVLETLCRVIANRCDNDPDVIDGLLDELNNAVEVEPDEHGYDGLAGWMVSHPEHAAKKMIKVVGEL